MTVPSGRLQFFALEASDYLERLGLIVGRPTAPSGEELVRLTRALRGAALMAGLQPFARAAQALELALKGYKEGSAPWTAERANTVASAVDELRRLVRQAPDWSERDTEAADALATALGGAGSPPRPTAAAPEDDLKPSVRSFVGREGALIASTLEHAAQAIEAHELGEAADVMLQRLQTLRGLAGLPSLSPLPEFLDAIELTIRTVQEGSAPPGAPGALRQVAKAVTQLARDVAEIGRPTADGPDIMRGARALLESFGKDEDVVDIATLFASGDPTPVVRLGAVPELRHTDPHIEMVSLADRFRQAADQLEAAPGPAARTLSVYSLSVQLASIGRATAQERPQLAALLMAARESIQSGAALYVPADFSRTLRQGAEQLARAAEGRNTVMFADQFDDLAAAFTALPNGPPPVAEPAPDPEADVVPIESLLAEEVVPPAPAPVLEPSPFETSFTTFHRLVHAQLAAVDEFADVVAIDTLLYRGRRALERADVVRRDLSVALKANHPFAQVEPLVSELIDLVPLALAE